MIHLVSRYASRAAFSVASRRYRAVSLLAVDILGARRTGFGAKYDEGKALGISLGVFADVWSSDPDVFLTSDGEGLHDGKASPPEFCGDI